jgi:hypothetical protein
MKAYIWQGRAGLEIVDGIRSVGQAEKLAEDRGAQAVEIYPKQGGKRCYRKDEQSGRWYRA